MISEPDPMAPEPLPGLAPPVRPPSLIEDGVRRTLAEMATRGYLDEIDAARSALAITLAEIIAEKKATGRMSTIGQDARVLLDLLDAAVPADTAVDEDLRKAIEEWSE